MAIEGVDRADESTDKASGRLFAILLNMICRDLSSKETICIVASREALLIKDSGSIPKAATQAVILATQFHVSPRTLKVEGG